MTEKDPRITKRRVTMTKVVAVARPDGSILTQTLQGVDYVRPDLLDAYVADASRRWQVVQVSDEPDAGPAGYDGATYVPFGTDSPVLRPDGSVERVEWHEFPHELAGTYFPATDCKHCTHAPAHPRLGTKARIVREG